GGYASWINTLKTTVDNIPALHGYSQTSRLNAATAIGASSDPFSVEYQGFTGWEPDTPAAGTARVHIEDASLVQVGDQLRATLITPEANYIYAVSGAEIGAGTNNAGSVTET